MNKRHRGIRGIRKLPLNLRRRLPGAGRKHVNPEVRDALFEWWVGLRERIDWGSLARANMRKGRKCLCRFPKTVLQLKVDELQAEWIACHLIEGERLALKTIKPTTKWFKGICDEYGLDFKG